MDDQVCCSAPERRIMPPCMCGALLCTACARLMGNEAPSYDSRAVYGCQRCLDKMNAVVFHRAMSYEAEMNGERVRQVLTAALGMGAPGIAATTGAIVERLQEIMHGREQLWKLLDDISTLGDAAKSDDKLFRREAIRMTERRSAIGQSLDGMTITWLKPPLPARTVRVYYQSQNQAFWQYMDMLADASERHAVGDEWELKRSAPPHSVRRERVARIDGAYLVLGSERYPLVKATPTELIAAGWKRVPREGGPR